MSLLPKDNQSPTLAVRMYRELLLGFETLLVSFANAVVCFLDVLFHPNTVWLMAICIFFTVFFVMLSY